MRVEPGALLVLGAAICWGTTGTLQVLAPAGASSLSVGAMRLLIGGLALLIFAAMRGLLPHARRLPPAQTLLAALAVAAYQLCFFAGVRRTGVAVGTLVAIGSAPVLAGAMAALFLRERQGLRWALSTALAVTGCVLLAGIGAQTASAAVDPMGVLLALGAGASYAIYTLASTRIVTAVPPDLAAAATFGLGALFLLPIFLVSDGSWLLTPRGVAAALALGLVATAAAYIMYTRALRTVKAGTAVTLALGEPLVATLLGVFLLGERLDVRGLVGLLLITAALLALTLRSTAPMQRAVERNNASTH
jgi:DME family drug/metabolite transporter